MLTDADIRAAKPRESAYDLTDGDGLELRVHPSGAKAWRFSYRLHGRRRRVPLGRYPDVKLGAARREAAILRGRVARGEDPAAERVEQREALTMADLLGADGDAGWYLTTYVLTAGKLGTAKTAKGIANDRSLIKTHLRGRSFLRKRVDAVTVDDLNAIKAKTTPSQWRKARNILLVCFRHAEEIGAVTSNPVTKTKASSDAKRERFLTPDERRRLDAALADLEELGPEGLRKNPDGTWTGGLSAYLVRALRLLVLTGMRRSEVLKLAWEDIDKRASCLRIVGKTGRRVVPLTPQALAFLKAEAAAAGGRAATGLVCCTGEGTAVHPEHVSRAWRATRKLAKLEDVRLHDLRHSWASDAVSAGVPLYVVGAALGHTQPNTTARYAHLHDAAIREGLAKAGAAIERATKGER